MNIKNILKNIIEKQGTATEFNPITDEEIDEMFGTAAGTGTDAQDYVVEHGTATASDGSTWTYKKWASGIAECIGIKTETLSQYTTMGQSYGMWWLYYSDVFFPFEFTASPNVVANACIGGKFTLTTVVGTETDHVRVFGGLHDTSGSLPFTSRVYVVGTWK